MSFRRRPTPYQPRITQAKSAAPPPVPKDRWDQLDIISKALAGVLIPIVLGYSVYAWNASRTRSEADANDQRTRSETATNMLAVAVGILKNPVPTDKAGKALRDWAITVMQNPSNPPMLTEAAAKDLASEPLPVLATTPGSDLNWFDTTKPFTYLPFTERQTSEAVSKILEDYFKKQPYPGLQNAPKPCVTPPCLSYDWTKPYPYLQGNPFDPPTQPEPTEPSPKP